MTYSQYASVEAFINEQQRAWIAAHVHMYEFFGGVTPILVPDNAPTATNRKQSDKYETVLIQSYEELAGITTLPLSRRGYARRKISPTLRELSDMFLRGLPPP